MGKRSLNYAEYIFLIRFPIHPPAHQRHEIKKKIEICTRRLHRALVNTKNAVS